MRILDVRHLMNSFAAADAADATIRECLAAEIEERGKRLSDQSGRQRFLSEAEPTGQQIGRHHDVVLIELREEEVDRLVREPSTSAHSKEAMKMVSVANVDPPADEAIYIFVKREKLR